MDQFSNERINITSVTFWKKILPFIILPLSYIFSWILILVSSVPVLLGIEENILVSFFWLLTYFYVMLVSWPASFFVGQWVPIWGGKALVTLIFYTILNTAFVILWKEVLSHDKG